FAPPGQPQADAWGWDAAWSGFVRALEKASRELRQRARPPPVLQFRQEALLVLRTPILAQLEFPFQQFDFHLEADDAAHQSIFIGVVDLRKIVAGAFVPFELGNQLGKEFVQFLLALDRPQLASRMDDREIPGRHDVPRFRVPGRRYVPVRAMKHDHSSLPAIERRVLRVLTRDVPMNRSIRAL